MRTSRVAIGGPDSVLELLDEANEHPANRTGSGELEFFVVRLALRTAEGRMRVWLTYDEPLLGDFFARLAAEWRGWDGKKVWHAYEGKLSLAASHDGLGRITLEVELHSETTFLWELRGCVALEAGRLDELARAVEKFWNP